MADLSVLVRQLQEVVVALQDDLDGLAIRVGSDSCTWPAAQNSNSTTVNHGLGRTPQFIGVQFYETGNVDWSPVPNTWDADATSFTVAAHNPDNALPAATELTFYWLVIG